MTIATAATPPSLFWPIVGIVGLVVFAVSSVLALYFGVFTPNPIGTYANFISLATLVVLIVLAFTVKEFRGRKALARKEPPPSKEVTKTVSTAAGEVQMVSSG